jgi:nucleoside 2-deoxyribosyltransferase
VYEDHIAASARELGLSVARGDDFFTSHSVMADIWAAIMSARAVIADCTGRNPNVFYEIGLAHAVGKPVILITQNNDDVPFDIRHLRYIQYDYTPRGMRIFEKRLTDTLSQFHPDGDGFVTV